MKTLYMLENMETLYMLCMFWKHGLNLNIVNVLEKCELYFQCWILCIEVMRMDDRRMGHGVGIG